MNLITRFTLILLSNLFLIFSFYFFALSKDININQVRLIDLNINNLADLKTLMAFIFSLALVFVLNMFFLSFKNSSIDIKDATKIINRLLNFEASDKKK